MAAKGEKITNNMLKLFDKGKMTDITIRAQGGDIKAHKMILGSQSEWFEQQFDADPGKTTFEVPDKYKVMYAAIRFMYAGNVQGDDLAPEDGLEMLNLSDDYKIEALDQEDVGPFILPRLTQQNCMNVLLHPGLPRHHELVMSCCAFVGSRFLSMLSTMEDTLLTIPRELLAFVLRTACRYVASDVDSKRIVQFNLRYTQLDSACDLLRETKQWNWGGDEVSVMRSAPGEEVSEGVEWCISGVRGALETTPARIVVGDYFEWCVRLDYGAEGKLRIVYESATPRGPREGEPVSEMRCINRFPAAMFAWRVLYRGQDAFNDKPVFICFPENVGLHWSTTLPINANELSDADDLRIMVNLAENPMLSLILYYFSADLKTTVFSEDILNRLPHIEYRCLSSYSIVKTHGGPD